MSHRFRSLLPPSCGDVLLANANSATITLSRWPGDDGQPAIDAAFELRGEIPLTANDAGELLAMLIAELRSPRREGGAAC